MSDFDIVRGWLPEEARTAAQPAYEALDHIEAENARLREENEGLSDNVSKYLKLYEEGLAELARLRWSLKNADEDNDALKAENARLREENCDLTERLNEAIHDLDERRNALKGDQ